MRLPRLHLIATGGTIAGQGADAASTANYAAGALGVETLLAAVPELGTLATFSAEQPFSIDSKDITPNHWLQLAAAARRALARPEPDGIVITHGTDTLEETGLFLDLVLPRTKPVVLTAAMRPATARSADGPMNLLQAAAAAACPALASAGPLVACNDLLWRAADCAKWHTHAPGAVRAADAAPVGQLLGTRLLPGPLPAPRGPAFPGPLPDSLPRVDVLCGYAGVAPGAIDAALDDGAAGLVLALAGHGSLPEAWLGGLGRARAAGIPVVRASRVPHGGVFRNANADDDALGTLSAGTLGPWRARVVLMCALAAGEHGHQLAARFDA